MGNINDILLNANMDIEITDGDFKVGDATGQSMKMLLVSQKGEWKQNPDVGVGVADYLKGERPGGLKAEIKRQLKADGATIKNIRVFDNGTINIDASY